MMVTTYRAAYCPREITLCDECAEHRAPYPLGPVTVGSHRGRCNVCQRPAEQQTFMSGFSVPHQCRIGWAAFASLEEAEAHQRECTDPDGVWVIASAPGYMPGDEWLS